jgi:dTDP-4-dehydrorhamnose 3,5-epimerase
LHGQKGTVRGLHFQHPPHAELKLVSCIRGEVFDVVIDIRTGSQNFLRWHGEHLSAGNNRALLIPEGFAHGFQALSDDVELIYCHSAPYAATAAEGGLNPQDPKLGIDWPLPIVELSVRDTQHPRLDGSFAGVSP